MATCNRSQICTASEFHIYFLITLFQWIYFRFLSYCEMYITQGWLVIKKPISTRNYSPQWFLTFLMFLFLFFYFFFSLESQFYGFRVIIIYHLLVYRKELDILAIKLSMKIWHYTRPNKPWGLLIFPVWNICVFS